MSVLMKVKHAIKSMPAFRVACERLGLRLSEKGTHKVWSRDAQGYAVKLRGWQYPVVVDDVSGGMIYDNHRGGWGAIEELDALMQAYSVAVLEEDARANGHVLEQSVDPQTGDIVIDVVLAGSEF